MRFYLSEIITYLSVLIQLALPGSAGAEAPVSDPVNKTGNVFWLEPTAKYLEHTFELSVQVSGEMVKRTISVAGQGTREYYIYLPASASDRTERSLLLSLHGGGGSASEQAGRSLTVNFNSLTLPNGSI